VWKPLGKWPLGEPRSVKWIFDKQIIWMFSG